MKGRFLTIKGRVLTDAPAPYRFYEGVHLDTFFGANKIKDKRRLVLVEGEFDAMYLQQFNIPAVATFGTGRIRFTPNQWEFLERIGRVFVSFDGDKSGKKSALSIMKVLNEGCDIRPELLTLPKGKDPNNLTKMEIEEIYKDVIL